MRVQILRGAFLSSPPTPLQSLLARRWRPQWVCHSCKHRGSPLRTLATTRRNLDSSNKPYYLTTPIFYVNADPHVGHMYTMILADVLKRWQILKGRQAILCTGTDEHGMKIQQAAAKAGIEPQLFCDKGAQVFEDLASRIDISDDVFIRTTSPKHQEAVEYAWQMLQDRGYIYESKHEGWYSVSDETFYPQSQVQLIVDPPTGRKIMVSIETGKEVEWTSERNYHFRLSAFREKLLELYQSQPSFIVPKSRMDHVVQQVTEGLDDLSVSRPVERLTWGIRVPTDTSQTIYVWLDALMAYASAAGYPFTPCSEGAGGWPADVHVVGKDIVRFHCVYWPAFLMALGMPLPKQILTHAHWTLGREKMAKSTGNVVNPFFALERFGVDAMRWYLVQDGGIADDASYDNIFIIEKYKKGLQGGLGNLLTRIMRGKDWNVPDAVKRFAHPEHAASSGVPDALAKPLHQADVDMYASLAALPAVVEQHMHDLLPNRALQTLMDAIYNANAHLQHTAPWRLAVQRRSAAVGNVNDSLPGAGLSSDEIDARIAATIFLNTEALRLVGIMMQPFIPTSAARLLDMLGVQQDKRSWQFCRIGADETYGTPFVDLGKGEQGVLFPRLTSST